MNTNQKILQQMRKVPNHLICPINLEIMKEPVMCDDGHTYQQSALLNWLAIDKRSPLTNKKINPKSIRKNYAIKNAIQQYQKQLAQIRQIIRNQKNNPSITNIQRIILSNGSHYQGQIFSGKPHGKGLQQNDNYQYQGQFKKGFYQGKGKLTNSQKKFSYNGEWKRNQYHGVGTFRQYSDNHILNKYSGKWKQGKKQGKGILQDYVNKIKYDGQWLNDKKHGKGKLIMTKKNQAYQGQFKDDKMDGKITLFKDGKIIYQGTFKDGKPDGFGTLITSLGYKVKRFYKNGISQ